MLKRMDKQVMDITEFNEVEVAMLKAREEIVAAIKHLNSAEYILRREDGALGVDQFYGFEHSDEEMMSMQLLKYAAKKISEYNLYFQEISMNIRLKIPKLRLKPYTFDQEKGKVILMSY